MVLDTLFDTIDSTASKCKQQEDSNRNDGKIGDKFRMDCNQISILSLSVCSYDSMLANQ